MHHKSSLEAKKFSPNVILGSQQFAHGFKPPFLRRRKSNDIAVTHSVQMQRSDALKQLGMMSPGIKGEVKTRKRVEGGLRSVYGS